MVGAVLVVKALDCVQILAVPSSSIPFRVSQPCFNIKKFTVAFFLGEG